MATIPPPEHECSTVADAERLGALLPDGEAEMGRRFVKDGAYCRVAQRRLGW